MDVPVSQRNFSDLTGPWLAALPTGAAKSFGFERFLSVFAAVVIDRMNGTAATANQPANDRHVLAYLKTVLGKLGLEGTNHKFRHSFCTIAVLAGVDFFTLRRWVGHVDEEALKIYVHIADEQAQVTMRQLAERRQAAGRPAKPARGRKGISIVSAQSRRSTMTRFSRSLGNKACSLRPFSTNGEGGIRTRGPAFDRTRL